MKGYIIRAMWEGDCGIEFSEGIEDNAVYLSREKADLRCAKLNKTIVHYDSYIVEEVSVIE